MSLADEPSHLGVAARVAEAYAPSDEWRSAYLDLLVKRGGTCRGCGTSVGDALLEVHPGVCATCFRHRHLRPDPALVARLAELSEQVEEPLPLEVKTFTRSEPPAQGPAEEEHMPRGQRDAPCRGCGTKSTRCKADCPTRKKPKAALAPKLVRKPRTMRVDDADELLERRKELLSELERVDEQLSLCLAAKEDELSRIKAAVQAATKRAAGASSP